MLCVRGFIVIAGALLLVPPASNATTIEVPSDQPTIQEGINAASSGDTVLLYSGTYTGPLNRDLDFHGVNLVLRSKFGFAFTTIDCQGAGRGLRFHSGEDTTAVVEGLMIIHAVADSGAAALCVNGSSPKFLRCRIRENTATTVGGGVCCYASSAIFRGCFFELNEAAGTAFPAGGALACLSGANATVEDCQITANTAASYGGGLYSVDSSPRVQGCWIERNTAPGVGGGAAFLVGAVAPTFTDCTFFENSAPFGGGIYGQSSPLIATGCNFVGNSASSMGGAVRLLYNLSVGQFLQCTFAENTAEVGGAIDLYDNANVLLVNCTLVANSAFEGGAIRINQASPTVQNSILAFSADGGAVMRQQGTESPSFLRCVLFENVGGNDLCGSVSDTLHRNPLFCDPAQGDYNLCSNSVCVEENNPWGYQIGAYDTNCPDCDSAVQPSSWGSIKALYR